MIRLFSLSLLFTAAGGAAASACYYGSPVDYRTGRTFSFYSPPGYLPPTPILDEETDVVIIRTELVRTESKTGNLPFGHGDYQENTLRHIIEDTLTKGSVSLKDRTYVHDPYLKEGRMKLGFAVWDDGIINTPETFVGSLRDSCGLQYKQMTLKPDGLYLAFVRQRRNGSCLTRAAPLDSPTDPIVEAYRKIVAKSADAPDRMNAEGYLKHMKDYIEIEVLECPKREDFRFVDSRFGTPEKQVNVLYCLGDRTREPRRPFGLRDAFAYIKSMNSKSGFVETLEDDYNFGDRYLYVAGNGGRYLRIENGVIDVSKIGTRITITGPQKVDVKTAKSWIREANEE